MTSQASFLPDGSRQVAAHRLSGQVRRWQTARTWARLIREAEGLWRVGGPTIHRVAALELMTLIQEVPPRLRGRVNRWLTTFRSATRLPVGGEEGGKGGISGRAADAAGHR